MSPNSRGGFALNESARSVITVWSSPRRQVMTKTRRRRRPQDERKNGVRFGCIVDEGDICLTHPGRAGLNNRWSVQAAERGLVTLGQGCRDKAGVEPPEPPSTSHVGASQSQVTCGARRCSGSTREPYKRPMEQLGAMNH